MIDTLRSAIYIVVVSAVVHSIIVSQRVIANEDLTESTAKQTVVDEQEQKLSSPTEEKMDGPVCGGLSSVFEKDEHVSEVVNGAKGLVEEKTGLKIASIDIHSYKKQMVSGMNYFVKALLKTEEGLEKIAHLRIYKDLKNNTELTAVQLDKSLDDKIEYFQ